MLRILISFVALQGCTTWNPPERFDRAYDGELIVSQIPKQMVNEVCSELLGENDYYGCAWEESGTCWVYIMDATQDNITPVTVLRHEIGHCNGWPGEHPE